MELNVIIENFNKELKSIEENNIDILKRSNLSIILCRNVLTITKSQVIQKGFESQHKEINFFKYLKQVFLVPLIFYSEVRSFELQYPKADMDSRKKFIKKKIRKLNRFFLHNIDFAQYADNNYTHFDQQYYTRGFLDNYHIISSKFYFQDPDFTTARDMLLGKLNAFRKLIEYLQNRLKQDKDEFKKIMIDDSHQLHWTSSKTALTELIYALHHNRAINNGKIDIKEIATALEKVFQFDLGDFYKIFSEIKSRKISRTKFLDDLSTGLLVKMDNSEE